jgi:hypothetical protein
MFLILRQSYGVLILVLCSLKTLSFYFDTHLSMLLMQGCARNTTVIRTEAWAIFPILDMA